MKNELLVRSADNLRALIVAMVEKAKSGHPGGSMGGADFISVLYSEFLNFDPDNGDWAFRDRLFLDPGHMSPMLYSVLSLTGFFSMEDLKGFRQRGSATPGHPEVDFLRGIDNASGPLGQGHAMAVGAALAERFLAARFGDVVAHKTYAYISDGGIQEEVSQGVGRIAGFLGLSNLMMFYDANEIQLSTPVDEVTKEDVAAKYTAWGWNVITINGNDIDEIRASLITANAEHERPTLIIGKTVMGKSLVGKNGESFEGLCATHGQPVSKAGACVTSTLKKLGADPENPFQIYDDVETEWIKVLEAKRDYAKKRNDELEAWGDANPELISKLENFLSNELSDIDFSQIEQKPNQATRVASSTVFEYLGQHSDNVIIMSADVAKSDNTDGYLKHKKAFARHDFSGNYLHAGVSELSMACICNGIALHGGAIPVCGMFFVFSDYIKPALRMSALMQLPVKYYFSHDSFRVGEDGATHEPVEQEMQLRLMEHVYNHNDERSTLVLRPADVEETTVAWKMAFETTNRPSVIIASRQNIKNLPALTNRKTEALQAEMGAYIVSTDSQNSDDLDVVLIGNGGDVSLLADVAEVLRKDHNLNVQLVSAISEGLFNDQDVDYMFDVLPMDVPRFGLTSGLPITLDGLVGDQGEVFGLDHFGYSAPAEELEAEFGFTIGNITNQVLEMLDFGFSEEE